MNSILHEQVLDNFPDGITIQDMDFKIIYQNKAMVSAFGEHKGEYCYKVYEKRNRICEGCGVQKAFLTGKSIMTLRVAEDINNTSSYWENSCFPLFNDKENIIAGVEVCRNITDRVTLEEEVKERNIELSQLNNQLSQKTNQLQTSLVERGVIEDKLRKEIKIRENTEQELHKSHGELRKTLEKLKQTQVKMLQSEKMASIGQLAAGIAHEINNPTGFVSSNLFTLGNYSEDLINMIKHYKEVINQIKKTNQDKDKKIGLSKEIDEIEALELTLDINFMLNDIDNLIKESQDGVLRIKKIVDDLKGFAHPGKDKPEYSNINENLDSTLNVIWNEIKLKATVVKKYGNIPEIMCYPQKLNQVFMNILFNAVQCMESEGEIRIGTDVRDEYLEIKISDTGPGISKDNITKIFDPFFTTKEIGKGTGLGLNIAYNIIEEHNGSISVESEEGCGTMFTIILPVGNTDESLSSSKKMDNIEY